MIHRSPVLFKSAPHQWDSLNCSMSLGPRLPLYSARASFLSTLGVSVRT